MRRCALTVVSATWTPANTSASTAAAVAGVLQWDTRRCCHQHAKGRKSYCSATSFKLQPHEVNDTNVPSAREVLAMIPLREELQQQLPSARELEAQCVQPPGVKTRPAMRWGEPPLWPNSDTVEEIMDEERYGSEEGKDVVPPPSPEHILLAWKALLWGSVYAVIGVAVVVCVAMYACGKSSVEEVLGHLRGRAERERRRLAAEGEEVSYYVVDLTSPATLVAQVQEVWHVLEELAKDGGEGEHVSLESGEGEAHARSIGVEKTATVHK
ncbi:hypothetical protein TraAM80_02174 [Trypanosoma rangeli]|uniref:Transmembrane protein n=1 Tax=Trypanosoma rangeli TaxID=5698 RepID=A0A3R7MX83_TRYRA|nr:uncharacterized protein TraAM80_02174 [Trypanosoma rangeli]RNF09462.1 hypothetical protein TraAM80_02174 [Trypanosoma rangeli]|eukprot:RNF09462.1 hypothetical protein TraAM80_02174 [Trypanosoma rangeli]